MAKPKGLSKADLQLWAAYAQTLRLLPGKQRVVVEAEPEAAKPAPQPDPPAGQTAGQSASAQKPKPVKNTGVSRVAVDMPPAGLDKASWRKFRTCYSRPAGTLDLHGMTAARAHKAVLHFVTKAHAEQLRVVEIITGKGEVLLRELPHWLNDPPLRPLILALAHPHAANTGSVRVLLRRIRK